MYRHEAEEMVEQVERNGNRLRGQLCEAIEAMGLPGKQEQAAIRLLKRISHDSDDALKRLLREIALSG